MIADLLVRSTRLVVRHRVAMLVALLLVTAYLGWSARHLHVEAHPDRLVPQEHEYIKALNDLHATFGDKNLIVVGLFPHDEKVFTPQFLAKIQALTNRIEKVPGVNPALVMSISSTQAKEVRGTADGIEVQQVMETVPADDAGAAEVRRRVFDDDLFVGTLVASDESAAGIQASFELTDQAPDYVSLLHRVQDAVDAEQD